MSYDLGGITITQEGMPADSGFRDMPVRGQGIIAVPQGEGPFPVALIVHGAYPFCTAQAVGDGEVDPYPCPPENDLRQYEGFDSLAAALAARGYLAIAPDLSAEFNNGFGYAEFGDRTVQLIDAHLDALAEGSGFPVDPAGTADLDQLSIIGHSRGGPLALRYAKDDSVRWTPRALVLLTPADIGVKPVLPRDLPAALLIAECDGDVGTGQPLAYAKRLQPLRPAPSLVYTLPGGTHNAFSTKLGADANPECSADQLMAPDEQRAIASVVVPGFLDLALAVAGR